MRYRIAGWALAGFLIAAFWAVYLFTTFHMPISRDIESAARLTCPIALVGEHYHFGVSLGWVLVSNAVVYGFLGLCLEPVRWSGHRMKPA
jgi:hypothetical protein